MRLASVSRTLISMPSSAASLFSPISTALCWSSSGFHEACTVMLNWPRVTCSSSASMFAFCSNKKLVIRATRPVRSFPMTVMVANFRIGGTDYWQTGGKIKRNGARTRTASVHQGGHALDQFRYVHRLGEIGQVVLRQEDMNPTVVSKAGDEDETMHERGSRHDGLEIKLVALETRHFHVADDRVVDVRSHLQQCLLAIECLVDEEILVRQDPLERLHQFPVIVHKQNRLELLRFRRAFRQIPVVFELGG